LTMTMKLRNMAVSAQRKHERLQPQAQPSQASVVHFQEPSATSLSQPPAVTLLDVMRNWQATNQPGAPQATQEDLLALMQLMQSQGPSRGPQAPAQQFGAYGGQGCGGAGSTFGQSPACNQHLGQQQRDAPYGSQPLPGNGFSGAGFGGVPPSGGFGVGALQPRSERSEFGAGA
jgi:hypothetical protein